MSQKLMTMGLICALALAFCASTASAATKTVIIRVTGMT